MDAVLLDTDVFSYLLKDGDTRAALYQRHVRGKTIALSFITVGELYTWSVRKNWGAKRVVDLEQRLRAAVIVPYDLELCKKFGQLKAELLASGIAVPTNDLWVAVCAVRHSLPLITHNYKDFRRIPHLNIISEAEIARPAAPSLFDKT